MATSIQDLLKDLSKEEILEDLLDLAKAAGLTVTAWQSGEPILDLVTILAEQFSRLWNNTIVKAIRGAFLDYAEGGWLTLLAWVTYGVFRRSATFAGSPLTVENRAGGVYTFNPGDVRVKNAAGKTFVNVTSGGIAAWTGSGDYPTVELDFVADEAGSASNTPSNGIQAYPIQPVTAPAGIYAITNADPIFGDDEESDRSLRERCRLATGPLSPAGPAAAYEAVARAAKRDDGTSVDVTRVRVISAGGGVVNVFLAGASGATTGDTSTEGTDVYIVNQAVQLKCVPAGITCNVAAATEHPIARTVTLRVDRGANITLAAALAAATTAVDTFFRELPIGGHKDVSGGDGYVFMNEIGAKASESAEGIIKASVSGSDELLDPDEVAVPTITITGTVVTQ